jgi:hypothetical protein
MSIAEQLIVTSVRSTDEPLSPMRAFSAIDEIRRWGSNDTAAFCQAMREGDEIRAARRGLWLAAIGPPRIIGYWRRSSPVWSNESIKIWLRNESPARQLTLFNCRTFEWVPEPGDDYCHGQIIVLFGREHLGTIRPGPPPEKPLGWAGRL